MNRTLRTTSGRVVGALVVAIIATTSALAQDTQPERPDGRALVEKAIESLGGAEAFKTLETAHYKIAYQPNPKVTLDFEVWRSGPRKLVANTKVPNMNLTFHLGLVDGVAWIRMGDQPARATGVDQIRQAGEMVEPIYALLDLLAGFEKIETVKGAGTGDDARWIVRFTGARKPARWGLVAGKAQPPVELVVAQSSGRPVALRRPGRTGGLVEERFEEPKPFGDLTVFTRVRRRDGRNEQVLDYTLIDLEFDDATKFEIPASLAKEPSTGTAPAEEPQRP